MTARQAKEFLVNETAAQASREAMPLSELEKRMMYFTENDERCEDPIALDVELKARCDRTEYEKKSPTWTSHAYRRIKKANPEKRRLWDNALRVLRKGDHYILVFWNETSGATSLGLG